MNQSPLRHSIIIISLLLYFFCSVAQEEAIEKNLTVFSNKTINYEMIATRFSTDVVVESITFESDVAFQQEEFLHLLGFKENDQINEKHIIAALERFAKKNKFLTIKINISTDENGVRLHLIFESEWTFRKIKIHNIYRGKHFFRQFYLMERGDVFDESKHNHSIIKIKEFLTNSGYFDRRVSSSFEYDYHTKEVIAHISIKRGSCFSFGAINVEIMNEDEVRDEYEHLCKVVRKKLSHALSAQSFTKDLLNAQLRELKDYLAKKGFLHSSIELEEEVDHRHRLVHIKFKITIQQKREIVFFGQHFFSKKELFDKILAFGQSVWLLPASLLAEEIVRAYKDKGFLNVEIAVQEEKERSFFIIKEGPRAVVTSVEIKNGTVLDQKTINKCCKKLLKHNYFDAQLYDEAIGCLTNAYSAKGFLIFAVVNYEMVQTKVEDEYTLVIFVDEGSRKYVTDVRIDGYPGLQGQGPFIRNEDEKIIFESKIIDEQRAWLVKHFQSLGYLHPRPKPLINYQNEDVSITWTIDLGEKVHFGKTIVLGSCSFPFSYLEHFLFYKEGDLWNQENIKRSFRALKDLEIFETIHFSADHSDASEDKPVLLKLHADDRYEIRTRAGLELQHVRKYQTFSGVTYKIGGTTIIKNPTNSADQLRFDCDFAKSHREIIGKYRRPWFTRDPFFTTLQVYSIMYDQPGFRVTSSVNDIYTVIQNGFLVGLQKKTQHLDIGWNNGCEWMKLHIKDDEELLSFAQAIDFKPQLIDKTVPFFFTEPTVMLERLDDALNPTRGGVGLFSLKMMIPLVKKYKDSFFFKALFEQSLFVPIRSVVVALRFRCGHIFYREFSGIMPSERFYLGGSHSLRGYESDLAPPLGVFVDDDGKQHLVPRGGKTMVNANIELRFPIWKKLGGVIFQDLGALSGTMFANFKTQDLLAATGFGMRVFTPLGPLRFDIGWRWRKQLAIERSFAWFLTFGQAF